MAAKKPSRATLEAELDLYKRQNTSNNVAAVLNNLIRWAGVVGCTGFVYLAISELAGQKTTADIGLELLADIKLSEVFAYLFGGGGVVYGMRQKKLRKDTVERLQDRVRRLEKAHDPNRTSSGLTPRGDTHPKDQ